MTLLEVKSILDNYRRTEKALRSIGGFGSSSSDRKLHFDIDSLVGLSRGLGLKLDVCERDGDSDYPWEASIPELEIFSITTREDMERHGLKQERGGNL